MASRKFAEPRLFRPKEIDAIVKRGECVMENRYELRMTGRQMEAYEDFLFSARRLRNIVGPVEDDK